MRTENLLAFSTTAYSYLAQAMCTLGEFTPGVVEVRGFPDGERYQRIHTPVEGRDVVLIGGTPSDTDTLELYDLASSIVKYGAESLTLVIPYFGYSTMERAVKRGEVVTAKTRARLFSSIPPAYAGNRVVLLDLHVSGIAYYFEGALSPMHVNGHRLVANEVKDLAQGAEFVLACTDAGRAKTVEALANHLGVAASFVSKRRLDGSRTEVQAVNAQVDGKYVLIYDDMIRSGSSLIGAAEAYKAAGATRIAALATHGLLPDDALRRLQSSGLFEAIVVSNSHPRPLDLANGFLRVYSIAQLMVDAVLKPETCPTH